MSDAGFLLEGDRARRHGVPNSPVLARTNAVPDVRMTGERQLLAGREDPTVGCDRPSREKTNDLGEVDPARLAASFSENRWPAATRGAGCHRRRLREHVTDECDISLTRSIATITNRGGATLFHRGQLRTFYREDGNGLTGDPVPSDGNGATVNMNSQRLGVAAARSGLRIGGPAGASASSTEIAHRKPRQVSGGCGTSPSQPSNAMSRRFSQECRRVSPAAAS